MSMEKFEEHKAFLRREIRNMEIRLEQAKERKGVREEEISCIAVKLRVWRELLELLEGMDGQKQYEVYWIRKPSEYEPDPVWEPFGVWHDNVPDAIAERDRMRGNPRCADAKIVVRMEAVTDYDS